jgi:hypothetical protein
VNPLSIILVLAIIPSFHHSMSQDFSLRP